MNSLRFFRKFFCVSLVVFLASCGGGNQEKNSTDTTGTDSTTVTTPAETNTIITTPQNMMIVIHKVANFAKWKPVYDSHDSARLANGVRSYVIGRGMQDSNMVMVALKVDDTTKAKAFAKDAGLKDAMKKGGVTGAPSISFVTITFQDTAVISSDIRSRSTFTVKDWDAWQKGFKEGEQERLNNGLTVRAYGHDLNDDHKVTLVTAVTDTTKAYAYWKSDMLKKRREASGVISEPQRFVFRIVERH